MKAPEKKSLWVGLAGSVTAAVLFALACPPFEYSLAAWLVPGILLATVRRLPYQHAFESGMLFGIVSGGLVSRWLPESLELAFGMSPLAASMAAYAGITVAVGFPCALLTLAYAYASRRVSRYDLPLVGTFFWVTSEWVRSQMIGWELLGHTQFRQLWLIQVADIGGVFAVSFVVAFVSIATIEIATSLATRRAGLLAAARMLVLPLATVAITSAYGAGALGIYHTTEDETFETVETEVASTMPLLQASYSPVSQPSSLSGGMPELRIREVSTVEQSGVRVSPLLCTDLLDTGVVRSAVEDGADVLINNCRVAWLADAHTAADDQHLALAVLRSVETRRFVVRSTNHGGGELITASGETLTDKPAGLSMTISEDATRYMQYGDRWLLLGFGLALVVVGRGRGAE